MVYKKFESIKLNIMKGRQLNPFKTASVIQDHEDRLKALESASASANSGSGSSGSSGSGSNEPQQEEQQTPVTRTLSFTINDGTDPIEGATVVIGSTTKTTGSEGGCTFTEMADDTYSVEVSATGYTTKTESITSDETHTSFTISLVAEPQQGGQQAPIDELDATRTLSFTINDGTNPIEGATVKIGDATKTTGSAGGCNFVGMPDDTYSVEVSKEGYTTKTESITSDETHSSFTISLVAEPQGSP